jgi:hypothetical protein
MSESEYSRAFWKRVNELSRHPLKCEKCGAVPSPASRGTQGQKGFREVRVRVTLHGDVPIPSRLHVECTQCFPDPVVRKTSRRDILAQILPLPFEGNTPNAK